MDNFLSNENKALLWQFLTDQGAFNNIPNNYLNKVQTTYESIITSVSKMTQYNLTDKNKLVLSEMQKNLTTLKNMGAQYKSVNTSNPSQPKKPSILSKPLEEVKIQMNEDYRNKQEEFIQLVKHNKPADIEFSDKEDKPLDVEVMNTMLNNMWNMREKDFSQINPMTKDAPIKDADKIVTSQNSISRDGSRVDMWSSFGNETNKKLDNNNDKERTSNDNDNFMLKLKTIKKPEVKEPAINNFLIEEIVNKDTHSNQDTRYIKIIENQTLIMATLKLILQKLDKC